MSSPNCCFFFKYLQQIAGVCHKAPVTGQVSAAAAPAWSETQTPSAPVVGRSQSHNLQEKPPTDQKKEYIIGSKTQ